MKKRYELTETELGTINTAADLIAHNFDVTCEMVTTEFKINDEQLEADIHLCTHPHCVKEIRKQLETMQSEGELEDGEITEIECLDFVETYKIDYCDVCNVPLIQHLNKVEDTFEPIKNHRKSKKVVEENYYELYVIFCSTPSDDYNRFPNYQKERNLFKEIVKWAEYVVKTLQKNETLHN